VDGIRTEESWLSPKDKKVQILIALAEKFGSSREIEKTSADRLKPAAIQKIFLNSYNQQLGLNKRFFAPDFSVEQSQ